MMQIIKYPHPDSWSTLLQRPSNSYANISESVRKILNHVKSSGDDALRYYTKKFDGVDLEDICISNAEWLTADVIEGSLKNSIGDAIKNIRLFHTAQADLPVVIEPQPGIKCWRKSIAIEKVGLYIPGGTAPLFSTLLMLAVPASIAGCREIVVCTPPDKNGKISPAILYAAQQLNITKLYKVGGAQAIAAMAYGTDTIPPVYKIFGPGNSYVTSAKMLLSAESMAIDMPAGPSELAILVDETCVPAFVAADLLSQAEHGVDSQVLLVSNSIEVINQINKYLPAQLKALSRKGITEKALENSKAVLVGDLDEGMELLNSYAPEHLIIACRDKYELAEKVVNAGSVFLGNYAPESAGDYATGTNHTLPTSGFAKAFSGVSLDSYLKKVTFQELSQAGLQGISKTVVSMAQAEGLDAHAKAITIRTKVYEAI